MIKRMNTHHHASVERIFMYLNCLMHLDSMGQESQKEN